MSPNPKAELDAPYSSPGASPTAWAAAQQRLLDAGVYWVSTVRGDGRPHVTPVAGLWHDGAFYFSTGAHEQKARNLSGNPHCVVTTGSSAFLEGLDVIIEGDAVRVTDEPTLKGLADRFASKYSDFFGFKVGDGAFVHGDGGVAEVLKVVPAKAFAYSRGDAFTATRYRFSGT